MPEEHGHQAIRPEYGRQSEALHTAAMHRNAQPRGNLIQRPAYGSTREASGVFTTPG